MISHTISTPFIYYSMHLEIKSVLNGLIKLQMLYTNARKLIVAIG